MPRWIEDTGFVTRLLPDDAGGSRHQRFIIELKDKRSLLVAHNIEVADRVPLGLGDRIHFRGLYEQNDFGGLVHWTHRDPMGMEDGGFIRYRSRIYS